MLQPHRKIDCVVRVVTPENIEFEYLVAGPFQRLPAFLVDVALRVAILSLILITSALAGIPLGASGWLTMTAYLLGYFVLSWLYGTFMETWFSGRTVGKMVFSLRVISADGRPINGSQAALRNLLRLCDFAPPLTLSLLIPSAPPVALLPTCLVGLVAMALTTRMQRVGDLAANTMVVWEGRRAYNTNLQPEDPRAYALAELIPATFQASRTLARATALYMERRGLLSMQRREELASNLAKPLLQQLAMMPDTSADLLLCAIYVRIYQSEDQRLSKIAAARKKGQLPSAADSHSWRFPQPSPTSEADKPSMSQPTVARPVAQPVATAISRPPNENVITAQVLTAEVIPADVIPAAVVPAVNQTSGKSGGTP